MGNVAAFKARITLESNEYIAGWKKVESATSNSVGGIESAIQKGVKSWSRSMGKAVSGFLGIQLADTLLKSIDDTLKNPMFENAGANIAYAIGEGLAKTFESIPVVGTIGKWLGQSESGDMEARQKASRDDAARNERMLAVGSKMVADLEKQRELASAVSDEQRTRVERAQRLAELEKQLNDQMAKENASGPQILAAREKLRAYGIAPPNTQACPVDLALPGVQGGWFAMPDPGLTAQFRARYEAAYGSQPVPVAGLAYDGIAAVGALAGRVKGGAPIGTADLTQSAGFAGVSGIFRLLPNGTNQRGLAIAQIRGNQVVVVDPAPRSFGGAGF